MTRVTRDVGVYGIEYRFVGEGTSSGNLSNVLEIVDSSETVIEGDIKLPRVASCFFKCNDSFVEVTIAFQWREDEEDDYGWRIRVVRLKFDPEDFDENLADMSATLLEDHIIDHDGYLGDMMPDVDYDPRHGYGDLWICYTRWVEEFIGTYRIFMVEGRRHPTNYNSVQWQNEGELYEAVLIPNANNGWLPRIAIGKCEIFELDEDWNKVIAYTAQINIFHTAFAYCIAGWNGWPPGDLHQFTVTHWEWGDKAGGCPMVDIGPPGTNYGAAVWTQTRDDGMNDVTISFGDNRGGYGDLHTAAGEEYPGSCMGSIAVHKYIDDDYLSSISYIRTDSVTPSELWLPTAVVIEADPNGGPVEWQDEVPISSTLEGKWDDASLLNHYYGMSTALTVYEYSYWMVWSAFTSGSTPDEVWGTYGYIDLD